MAKINRGLNLAGQRDILLLTASLLERHKINYLLTGSLAVSYYGYPRATHDIDFIIEVRKEEIQKLFKAIKKLGRSFLVDELDIKEAVKKSSQFNLYHPQTGIKIDFWISPKTPFELNKFKRKIIIFMDKQKISLISAEDLILTKLLWSKRVESERHLRDASGILKIQGGRLDEKYLNLWAKKLDVANLLKKVLAMEYS